MAEKLVDCAKAKKVITICELGNSAGLGRRQVGKNIGVISKKCQELGLPLLSVLAVYKTTRAIGSGFIKEFFPKITNENDKDKVLRNCIDEVYNQSDWSALLDWACYENLYPDETTINFTSVDGKKRTIKTTYYERNPKLRRACIEKYGTKCAICGFDAASEYGEQFKGKIHIHHITPLNITGECTLTEDDLRPVCPNCHMILHSKGKNDCYSIDEVKAMLKKQKGQR